MKLATLALIVLALLAAAFYGPPVGAQKKACLADGGSWWASRQVCTLP